MFGKSIQHVFKKITELIYENNIFFELMTNLSTDKVKKIFPRPILKYLYIISLIQFII